MYIHEYLTKNTLLFDGSMGTYCDELFPDSVGTACELLNLEAPEKIGIIHKSYIDAGAKAIKTNTFSANRFSFSEAVCKEIISAGFKIAAECAEKAYIFADIGPISPTDCDDVMAEYRFLVDCFLEIGAENFLFETNAELGALQKVADYIKSKKSNAYVIVSFAVLPDGFTRGGRSAESLISAAQECDSIDAVGLNCGSGARHMAKLALGLISEKKPFSAMPNAGYPTVMGNRTFYDGSPSYFARQIGEMAAMGAKILGGCCGTTPDHIRAAAMALTSPKIKPLFLRENNIKRVEKHNKFLELLNDPDARPIAVELDPPAGAEIESFLTGAELLKSKGAAVITVADCPVGRPRMDSSLLACKLRRELDIDVLPHMTCRDRNLNAIKALLWGLCAEGVHNCLIVTGDPIPSADRSEVKSVYNFNSRMLAAFISELNQKSLPTPFNTFAALNLNAQNFDIQLRLAKEKEANGICGFLTQPILSERAFRNLQKARKALSGKILGGIFPLVSHRNACFMNSEVSGVSVDDGLIKLYENKTREEAEALALEVSTKIAAAIKPLVDGYYLMTPFSRTELVGKIMEEINKL